MVDEKFPYGMNAVIANFTVESPEVYLEDPKIGIRLAYIGNLLENEIKGDADLNGRIAYQAEEGVFYLRDFEIVGFSINQTDFSQQEILKAAIESIVNNCLDDHPIHRLNQAEFKEKLGKLLLREIRVRGENLILVLGP